MGSLLFPMSKRGFNKTMDMILRIKAIESEFDEPLRDIVIVMRRQVCKWDTVAGALGVSNSTLKNWRKRFGFCRPVPEMKIYESKPGGKSPIESIARKHGYKSFDDLYRDMRLSKRMSVDQVARKIGVTSATIRKWTPEELKGIRYTTDACVKSAKVNLVKARANVNRSRHPWNALVK